MKQVYYSILELESLLQRHIIRGDRSDGIPNIHSADNCFVKKIRQTPITKKIETMICNSPDKYCDDNNITANYERNKLLIDFDMIPNTLYEQIVEKYKLIRKPHLLTTKKICLM